MFISDLYISNYRSVKSLHIPLGLGRNVLIGKNNCGKSNIIKAIDLVIGDRRLGAKRLDISDFNINKINERGFERLESAKELFVAVKLKCSGLNLEIIREETTYIHKQIAGVPNWYDEENGTMNLSEFLKKDNADLDYSEFKKLRGEEREQWIKNIEEIIFYIHAQREGVFLGQSPILKGVIVKIKHENFYSRCLVSNEFGAALEELEFFLHSQARIMLPDKFVLDGKLVNNHLPTWITSSDKFLLEGKTDLNQVIIATHSEESLKNTNIENIIIIKKAGGNSTKAYYIRFNKEDMQNIQKVRHILRNKNSELYITDKVILIEGGEKYLMPAIADSIYGEKGYLDSKNISTIQVGGKSQFPSYIKILQDLDIKYCVIADFDYLERGLEQISRYISEFDSKMLGKIRNEMKKYSDEFTNAKVIRKRLLSPQQNDAMELCRLLDEIVNKQEYDSRLEELWTYLRPKVSKKLTYEDIKNNEPLSSMVENFIIKLSKSNVFLLRRGELENYFTELAKRILMDSNVRGKELSVLVLLEVVFNEQYTIRDLIDTQEYGNAIRKLVEM